MARRLPFGPVLISAALLGCAIASAQVGVWAPVGPTNATVMSLQQDPFTSTTLYAGLYFGGIFRSLDSGHTWTPLASPFTSDVVFTLACDPSDQGTFYAGTFQHGLYKTTNGGVTWISINGSIPSMDDEAFGIDPNNTNVLILGSGAKGYRSTDGGATWTTMSQNVRSVLFDSAQLNVVYIDDYANGLMKSTDDGVTFASFNTGIGTNTVLSLHQSQDGNSLFAAALQGIFELDTGQSAWTNITGSLAWDAVGDILSLPGAPNTLVAATDQGVFTENKSAPSPSWVNVSTIGTRFLYAHSGGELWVASSYSGLYSSSSATGPFTLSENGIQNYFVEALAAVPLTAGTQLFAGTDRGAYTLPSGGAWNSPPGLPGQTIFSLVPHPTTPSTVYAGTQTAGVWSTTDAGAHWSSLANGMVPRQVTAITQFVDVKQVILAATTNGIFQSLDNGVTWNETLLQAGVLSLATDPSVQASAYAGSSSGQVLHTKDYGATFQTIQASGLPASNVVGLTAIPYDKVYAILANGQSYALYENGSSWIQINAGIPYPITCVAGDPSDITTAYMGTSGGGIYKSTDFGQTWTQFNTNLGGMYVYGIVVDPSNSNSVFAATNTGVYHSANKASAWNPPGTGLPNAPVLSLLINPKGSMNLAASVLNQGVYRSTDGGATWRPATVGPPPQGALALGLNPLFPATLYAGSANQGLYISTDSGDHWTASNSGLSVFVRAIIVDPTSPSRMFAASLSDGLFASTNAGASWTNIALNDRNLFGLTFDPTNTQTLYAGSSIGVTKSTDGGSTWHDLGQHNPYLFSMVVDPTNTQTIYTSSTQGKVYASRDGGNTWSEAANGLALGNVIAMAIDPSSDILYAAVDLNAVFRSTNDGTTWSACGILPAMTTSSTTGLSVDSTNGTIYLSGNSVGVFRSTDGCQNWQSSNAGVYSANIASLLASRRQSSLLFAGTNGAGLYRSLDGASTWSLITKGPGGTVMISLAEDPITAGTFYAGTDTGVYRSTDNGVTWTALGSGLPAGVGVSALLPAGGTGNLYAVAGQSGLYALTAGAGTWKPVTTNAGASLIRNLAFGSSSQVLYAATLGSGFLLSSNAGSTWTPAISLSNVQTVTDVVLVDPTTPQTVYSATGGTGVQKSTDGGATWQAADTGLTQLYVVAMVMDPTNSSVVIVGTAQGGVFITRNGAQSWTPVLTGLYDRNVVSLALDPNNHNILYAGTEGAGVFRIQLQ